MVVSILAEIPGWALVLIPAAIAVIAPYLTYKVQSRKQSGSVRQSEAADLWARSERMLDQAEQRLVKSDENLAKAEAKLAEADEHIGRLTDEIGELRDEMAQLRGEMELLRKEGTAVRATGRKGQQRGTP